MFKQADEGPDTLPFLVSLDDHGATAGQADGEKGIFGRRDTEPAVRQIPITVLRENLRRTVDGLRELFDEIAATEGRMPLRQAQIAVEVTASGGITLVGTSAQVAGTAAITLTFGE
ncbi:hypothetical protein [Frankia sp. Cas4]|uniref:Pepco domain-containing protein n=1 Tax=Frankia sp. Cas4 TaxID=3073927 RepID=UPI002AD272D7|nr:hypothetical protein [Frankia sp. Cas4]